MTRLSNTSFVLFLQQLQLIPISIICETKCKCYKNCGYHLFKKAATNQILCFKNANNFYLLDFQTSAYFNLKPKFSIILHFNFFLSQISCRKMSKKALTPFLITNQNKQTRMLRSKTLRYTKTTKRKQYVYVNKCICGNVIAYRVPQDTVSGPTFFKF